MAGLQRSATSFRRQGSSGLVWDDKLLTASGELIQLGNPRGGESSKTDRGEEEGKIKLEVSVPDKAKTGGSMERSRSNRGFRTGKVSPAIEPPSPKVSACGFCSAFGKNDKSNRRPKSGPPMLRRNISHMLHRLLSPTDCSSRTAIMITTMPTSNKFYK